MNLRNLLVHLHDGAYQVFQDFVLYLGNSELKALRLTVKQLARALFPYMFQRIYFSAHQADLSVFRLVIRHRKAANCVQEIIIDDTEFEDDTIFDVSGYRNALVAKSPQLCFRSDFEQKSKSAFSFWMYARREMWELKDTYSDMQLLRVALPRFTNLKQITILGRIRGSPFESDAYWQTWQTPRHREWSKNPLSLFLLQPTFYKPLLHPYGDRSEGRRPVNMLVALLKSDSDLKHKVRSLRITSLRHGPNPEGTGQRKLEYDPECIPLLMDKRPGVRPLCLNLILEAPIFHPGLGDQPLPPWDLSIGLCLANFEPVLEELTLAHVDLHNFLHFTEKSVNEAFLSSTPDDSQPHKALQKLKLENCTASTNPLDLFRYLQKSTSVRQIEMSGCHSKTASWPSILTEMKNNGLGFDRFELRACPSIMENWAYLGLDPETKLAAPWNGSSEEVVSWLRGDKRKFPLWQGPG